MDNLQSEVHQTLAAITDAWRQNKPLAMQLYLHPDIVMSLPGFSGTVVGRQRLIDSFIEFCTNARVLEYSESQEQIHVAGGIAIATFRFDMLYERSSYRERSTGRDLWVFDKSSGRWLAVWRTLLELQEDRQTIG
jgi:hypothetical protein